MPADLLFEIGCEEIPAKMLAKALADLPAAVTAKLAGARLEHKSVKALGTPRRLAVIVKGLAERQPDLREEVVGPPVSAAFAPDGSLTKAGQGFAAKNGVDPKSWKTWGDMIASCKTLRAKGIEPIGVFMTPEWSTYQWLDDIIVTGAWADQIQGWYLPKYNSEYLPWRQLNAEEFAKAVKEGKFSTKDPRFDTYLKLTKDVADNCLVKGFAGISQYDDVLKLFHDGKVAMAWLGSWTAPSLGELPFKVGSTYLPPFGKDDSPYEINKTSYRVGGPSSSGQWGLTP